MNRHELAQLKQEPACEHNSASKSGCSRSKPGATAGGCCFDGAQISLFPITDVAHLIHGPIACAGNSWDNRGSQSVEAPLFRLGYTTDLNEQDVIMGRSEKRLLHSIRQIIDEQDPSAVFVYTTCVPALQGDDVVAICALAQQQFKRPVILVDAAGFYGSKNLGNRIAGDVMVNHVIGTAEPPEKPTMLHRPDQRVHDIALIGEYNIAGELWYVTPLLAELGYRLLGTLSGDAQFHQIQTLHRADALMVVCSRAQVNVARRLEERYRVPWFEGSFYGIRDMSMALRRFANFIDDDQLRHETEALIHRETERVRQALIPYRTQLKGKRALLYTGGVKSWSIVSALQELGMTVVATGTKKSTAEDKARIQEIMGSEALMLDEGDANTLLNTARALQADILIAGGRNQYTAIKAKLAFLDINQEREHAYAGYEGMINLARNLSQTLLSPVWSHAVQQPEWL